MDKERNKKINMAKKQNKTNDENRKTKNKIKH